MPISLGRKPRLKGGQMATKRGSWTRTRFAHANFVLNPSACLQFLLLWRSLYAKGPSAMLAGP